MPRTLQQILDQQEELAARFESYEPDPTDERDPEVHKALLAAASNRAAAEATLADAVRAARDAGYSWTIIGTAIGTTGAAAQQRYGHLVTH